MNSSLSRGKLWRIMPPNPALSVESSLPDRMISRLLGISSFGTMLMTIPQVLKVWLDHQAAGVSLISWCAYLLSALLWFWYGLRRHSPNIYLACIGWMTLDAAVIIGVLMYR